MLRTEHGMVPLPRPEVMEMLHGVPTYSRGIPVELVTGTGAAILASVSEGYGDLPMMRAERVGYGAGHLRLDFPNVLRVVIGEEEPATGRAGGAESASTVEGLGSVLVSASVPERSSRDAAALIERLTTAGAIEAWLTSAVGAGREARSIVSAMVSAEGRDSVVEALRNEAGVGTIRWTPTRLVTPE
jgi:uncharacterized protein (DUF111 family)